MVRSHSESRKFVCVICFEKCLKGRRDIVNSLLLLVKQKLPTFDLKNEAFPSSICDRCRKKLSDDDLQIVNYSDLNTVPESTTSICQCDLCSVARLNYSSVSKFSTKKKIKRLQSKTDVIKICRKCLSEIGKGRPHHCTKTVKVMNCIENAGEVKEQVSCSIIQEIRENRQENNLQMNKGRGVPMNLQIVTKRHPLSKNEMNGKALSADNMQEIQDKIGLSENAVKTLISLLRKDLGRKIVAPSALENIQDSSHRLDDYFEFVVLNNMTLKNGSKGSAIFVYASKLNELVAFILEHRNIDEAVLLKLSADGGGNSLKFFLSVEGIENCRGDNFKYSGVKRAFILGLVENVTETYDNLKELLSYLVFQNLIAILPNVYFVGDLKIINLLLGTVFEFIFYYIDWDETIKF